MGRYTHFSLRLLNILPGIVPFQAPKIPRRYECECASSSIDRLIASIERYRERIDKRNLCIATLFCAAPYRHGLQSQYESTISPSVLRPLKPLRCHSQFALFHFRLHKVDSPAVCLTPGDDQHIDSNVVVFLSLSQARCRAHPSTCAVSLSQAYRGPSR